MDPSQDILVRGDDTKTLSGRILLFTALLFISGEQINGTGLQPGRLGLPTPCPSL